VGAATLNAQSLYITFNFQREVATTTATAAGRTTLTATKQHKCNIDNIINNNRNCPLLLLLSSSSPSSLLTKLGVV